jgi:hypothetical protein
MLRHFAVLTLLLAFGLTAFGAERNPVPSTKTYDLQIENVYAAVVQVASVDYNLKFSLKDGHVVNFFTGGQHSLVLNATCREAENNKTLVSLNIAQAVGNPQIFGVAKALEKEQLRFWSELDKAVRANQSIGPSDGKSEKPATPAEDDATEVLVKSTPDGADTTLDGKFVGSTPSTLQIKAGDHSVGVEANGFVPWSKTLTITGGGQITLNANLQRKPQESPQ